MTERYEKWKATIEKNYGSLEAYKEQAGKLGKIGGKARVPKGWASPNHPMRKKKK